MLIRENNFCTLFSIIWRRAWTVPSFLSAIFLGFFLPSVSVRIASTSFSFLFVRVAPLLFTWRSFPLFLDFFSGLLDLLLPSYIFTSRRRTGSFSFIFWWLLLFLFWRWASFGIWLGFLWFCFRLGFFRFWFGWAWLVLFSNLKEAYFEESESLSDSFGFAFICHFSYGLDELSLLSFRFLAFSYFLFFYLWS